MPSESGKNETGHRSGNSNAGHGVELYDLLRSLPVAVYHIDLVQPRFLMVNELMCRESGYTEEELLAMNPMEVLSDKGKAVFQQRLQAMASGQYMDNDIELEIVTRSGECEWAQFHIHHIYEGGKITSAYVVAHTITERKKVQEELTHHSRELERLVKERTGELSKTNRRLREEVAQRTLATEKLQANSERLEEMNTAMRVLLDKRNEDQLRTEEIIRLNLKELIDPYLERLENSDLRSDHKQLVGVIRMNLEEVVGSVMPELSSKYFMFSPSELRVVNLIRTGKTTKEIARLLNLSTRTVEAYRNSIRRKLDLKNKKINLRTYLSSI